MVMSEIMLFLVVTSVVVLWALFMSAVEDLGRELLDRGRLDKQHMLLDLFLVAILAILLSLAVLWVLRLSVPSTSSQGELAPEQSVPVK